MNTKQRIKSKRNIVALQVARRTYFNPLAKTYNKSRTVFGLIRLF